MTQDRNSGNSRVAIQKMQYRVSSLPHHVFDRFTVTGLKRTRLALCMEFRQTHSGEPHLHSYGNILVFYSPPAELRVCVASRVHCSCDGYSSKCSRISSLVTMA